MLPAGDVNYALPGTVCPAAPHQRQGPYRKASRACVEVGVAERADDDRADNALRGPQGAFR